MKKNAIIATLIACVVLLAAFVTTAYVQAANKTNHLGPFSPHPYNCTPLELYESCYARATDTQKKQLENIQTGKFGPYVSEYPKQVLIIMGDLPADTPQLTLAQARAVCENITSQQLSFEAFKPTLLANFNTIAGAPDYDGGCGLSNIVYYLNEQGTEYIMVFEIGVRYINEDTNTHEKLCWWNLS